MPSIFKAKVIFILAFSLIFLGVSDPKDPRWEQHLLDQALPQKPQEGAPPAPKFPAPPPEPLKSRMALPGYQYEFPRDFGAHEDFSIEWWYYTGNLKSKTGRRFGYQLTFFRVGLGGLPGTRPSLSLWNIGQIYFAHLTVSDIQENKFHYFERINRQGIKNAGAATGKLKVWNENWTLKGDDHGHHLKAFQRGTGMVLDLIPIKNMVVHGKQGVSRKGEAEGNASHYFSYTRMRTTGKIFINGQAHEVTGTSWMDHEFSSDQLNPGLVGWDWFSMKLDNQAEIMLYQLRKKGGGVDPYSSGTLVLPNEKALHLGVRDFTITPLGSWQSPRSMITYPARWLVTIPGIEGRLEVVPDIANQELRNLRSIGGSYWEGSVSIRGTLAGKPVRGEGYVELVGYGKPLKQNLPR